MSDTKTMEALHALKDLSVQAVNDVKIARGDSASMRVSGFARKLIIFAKEMYPIAHCIDPKSGIDKTDSFCAEVLALAADKGVTKANKRLRDKQRGLEAIKELMKRKEGSENE